jgi:lysophospholipase L1-like esterase
VASPAFSAGSIPLKIITYGDSLTAGLSRTFNGVVSCPDGVSLEVGRYNDGPDDLRLGCYGNGAMNKGGYQPELALMFEQENFVPSIANYGYSGIRSDQMIPGLIRVVNAAGPDTDYIVIMAGANDAVEGISTSTVIANLSAMVTQAQGQGLVPIISTVTRNIRASAFDLKTAQYSEAIRVYAVNNNILLADSSAALSGNWLNYNSGDGLHLNEDGNSILAAVMHEAFDLDANNKVIMVPIINILLDD